MGNDKILVINPGSTSTKVAIYSISKGNIIIEEEISHDKEQLANFKQLYEQKDFRKELILNFLSKNNIALSDLAAVIGRGGLLHPIEGGVYRINEKMLDDLKNGNYGTHASNLGAILAHDIAKENDIPNFIADPITINECEPYSKVSGFKGIYRRCRAHVLNIRQVAHELADKLNKSLDDLQLIGVHMGGGVTVAALKYGKFIDTNDGMLGDGPFSPERTGTLPVENVIDMAYSGKYSKKELKTLFAKKGGLYSYLGTNNVLQILEQIKKGDKEAEFYIGAFTYRIAKTIGEMATVLFGKVDGIFLTGGIARSDYIISLIKKRVNFIAPVYVFPGQFEMYALGRNAHFAIIGKKKIKEYE